MPKAPNTKSKTQKAKISSKIKSASPSDTSPRSILRGKINGKEVAILARRGSYRAANNPRSRVQTPYGGSGDQQADPWSRRIVRELSRDMERNADSYRTLLDDWTRWVVGTGVKAMFKTDDQEWNELAATKLDEHFSKTRDGIDARQMRSWYDLQADFARAVAMDGDAAIIKLNDFTVQMVESEQITSGTSSMSYGPLHYCDGVNLTEGGAPVSFTICPFDNQTGALDYGQMKSFLYEHVEFAAVASRFSQTRGMPLIVAGLEDWERIDSYKESEVIAAEQGSMVYGAIEYPEGNMGLGKTYLPGQNQPGGPTDGQPSSPGFRGGFNDSGSVDWHGVNAGYLLELPNGVKYVPVNPQRPSKDAAPFMIEMLRHFTSNAGLPYEIVYNDLRGLSWSVHRGMVALARDKVRSQQEKLFKTPFKNIAIWAVANLIESGELPANDDFENIELIWPEISWPDEGKEYEAQNLGLTKGLTTRHRVFGPQWRKMLDERMEEITYAAELCVKFNKAYAEDPEEPGDKNDGMGDEEVVDDEKDVNNDGDPDIKAADQSKKNNSGAGLKKSGNLGGGDPFGIGLAPEPSKPKIAGFRITPQELLGYVDFQPDSSGSSGGGEPFGGKPGAKKDSGKVGGADELKTKKKEEGPNAG